MLATTRNAVPGQNKSKINELNVFFTQNVNFTYFMLIAGSMTVF